MKLVVKSADCTGSSGVPLNPGSSFHAKSRPRTDTFWSGPLAYRGESSVVLPAPGREIPFLLLVGDGYFHCPICQPPLPIRIDVLTLGSPIWPMLPEFTWPVTSNLKP